MIDRIKEWFKWKDKWSLRNKKETPCRLWFCGGTKNLISPLSSWWVDLQLRLNEYELKGQQNRLTYLFRFLVGNVQFQPLLLKNMLYLVCTVAYACDTHTKRSQVTFLYPVHCGCKMCFIQALQFTFWCSMSETCVWKSSVDIFSVLWVQMTKATACLVLPEQDANHESCQSRTAGMSLLFSWNRKNLNFMGNPCLDFIHFLRWLRLHRIDRGRSLAILMVQVVWLSLPIPPPHHHKWRIWWKWKPQPGNIF